MIPPDSPYDIKLSSGREAKAYGLILDKGSSSLTIGAVAQDDSVYVRNVGKRVGDFDEQRNWQGGQGVERFSDNSEGFYSSTCWTRTKGHLVSGLLRRFAYGLRKEFTTLGNTKYWFSDTVQYYLATKFTPNETGTYTQIQLWLKCDSASAKKLEVSIFTHLALGNAPLVNIFTAVEVSPFSDNNSRLYTVAIPATALTAGTNYWVVVKTNNSWHVAMNTPTANLSKYDVAGGATTWVTMNTDIQFRLLEADVERKFFQFIYDGHTYMVDYKDDAATASQLYINGDRGQATGGTTTTLVDANFGCRATAWPDNTFQGARIRYKVRNKWFSATITSHTGGTYTFAAQASAPDVGSNYFIYSTHVWMELTTTGLGVVINEPAVFGGQVYFPQGDTVAMRVMSTDFTAATNHKYRSEATAASMYAYLLRVENDKMWRANNDTVTVSNSPEKAYGTDLAFTTAIKVGDISYPITSLVSKDGTLMVFKENGGGTIINGVYTKLDSGEQQTPDPANGVASISIGQFIFHSWLHSVIRVFGTSHDNIGTSYSALPNNREGDVVSMDSYITDLMIGVDAGTTGTSTVLTFDGLGWHELMRGYDTGKRIRMVRTQPNVMRANIVWVQVGNDLMYVKMPYKKESPLNDAGALYQHESIFESSAIDMGAASNLPKFIKSLTITAKGLATSSVAISPFSLTNNSEIYVYYQTDDNCFTDSWIFAGVANEPESTLYLGLANIQQFRYRLVVVTGDSTTPVDILGVIPNGYARTPLKQIFTMRIQAGGIYQAGSQTSANSSKLWKWLMDNARFPYVVKMESKYEEADNYTVIVHPPKAFPYKPPQPGIPGESFMTLVLEEA